MFPVSKIIDAISNYYQWEEPTAEKDIEDKKGWARQQYQFLVNHIFLQDMTKFKKNPKVKNSPNFVPIEDVPLVAALLLRAVSMCPEDRLILEWFNGNIFYDNISGKGSYKEVVELCDDIDNMLVKMCTDDDFFSGFELKVNLKPTLCERTRWISAIRASLNYDAALGMSEIQKRISEIYTYLLPLNNFANVYRDNEKFCKMEPYVRKRILLGRQKENIGSETITQLLAGCYTQDDYIKLMINLLEIIMDDEKRKLIKDIFGYVNEKKQKGWNNISDSFGTETIIQDDLRRFQNIYELLKNDQEALRILEEKSGESNLLEFFRVEGKNEKKNNKKK